MTIVKSSGCERERHVGDLVDVDRHVNQPVPIEHEISVPPTTAPRRCRSARSMRPCSMKIRRMLSAGAAHRLQDGDVAALLHHQEHEDATMFSAATITIRPMVIEIAIFSSHSAEKSAPFRSAQSCARYRRRVRSEFVGDLLRREHVRRAELDHVRLRPVEDALARRRAGQSRSWSRTRTAPG